MNTSGYSNEYLRKSLLLLSGDLDLDDHDGDDDLDALATINRTFSSVGSSSLAHINRDKRRRGNDSRRIQQGNERKTRLSWELHPDLILHDFILELEAIDNGTHRILDLDDGGSLGVREGAKPSRGTERGEKLSCNTAQGALASHT
ncbi:hypothetical protein ACHAXM_001776 [Skeletonema potamos]|jgi:hypothetical protein